MKRFNLRCYAIIINDHKELLLSDEYRNGHAFTKLVGGGLEWGEGSIDCLKREIKENKELTKVVRTLSATIQEKDNFKNLLIDGETLLIEAYESIANKRPYQISRIRTFAEKICAIMDEAPYSFLYLYANRNLATIEMHALSASIFGVVIAKGLSYSRPKQIDLVFCFNNYARENYYIIFSKTKYKLVNLQVVLRAETLVAQGDIIYK